MSFKKDLVFLTPLILLIILITLIYLSYAENSIAQITETYLFPLTTITSIAILAIWLWMLKDAAERPLRDRADWIIIIVLLSWLGAAIYYFIKYRKNVQDDLSIPKKKPSKHATMIYWIIMLIALVFCAYFFYLLLNLPKS